MHSVSSRGKRPAATVAAILTNAAYTGNGHPAVIDEKLFAKCERRCPLLSRSCR